MTAEQASQSFAPVTFTGAGLDEASRQTMDALMRHQVAMASNDPATIAADYSEDVILLLNFLPEPLVGKAAQMRFLEDLFDLSGGQTVFEKILANIGGTPSPEPRMLKMEAVGEFAYLIADLGNATLTETYVVRNREIVFESVVVVPNRPAGA